MPSPAPHRSPAWSLVYRSLRFFYLLWGGMLLLTLATGGRLRLPSAFWRWPAVPRALASPVGQGLCLGLGLVMAVAALMEVWELVDLLLVRFLQDGDR